MLDEFLSAEATDRLFRRYTTASSASDVQRQSWTDDLGADVRSTVLSAAGVLSDATGYWLHRWSKDTGAVTVPVGPMLAHAARTFGPGDYDLVLVSDEADDGIRLAWDHLPDTNEYELVRWGDFRRAG